MGPAADVAVFAAGMGAGTVNAIVGSGSLITFPTLVALGYPPLLANVSNTVGLVPGSVSGAVGYRRELAGQRRLAVLLAAVGGLGGLVGGVLLLASGGSVFAAVVPGLILAACLLVALQPPLARALARRRGSRHGPAGWLLSAIGATGVYGGYFGAAQGVLLLALMAIGLEDDLQRLNAVKNVIAAVVNGVAGLLFIAVTHVDWVAAALIAAGSTVGGQLGAHVGRRLPAPVLRMAVVVVGTAVAVYLLVR